MTIEQEKYIRENYLNKSGREIARILGISKSTVQRYTSIWGLKKPDGTMFNYKYFDEWSRKTAYLLGYFCADGSISYKDGSHYDIQFRMSSKDRELMDYIVNELEVQKRYKEYPDIGTCGRLSLDLSSKYMCDRLIELGIVPNKSYDTGFMCRCPEQYERDFIRGFIDGDGSVSNNKTYLSVSVMSGQYTKYFLQYIVDVINKNTNVGMYIFESKREVFISSCTGKRATKVCDWIYSDLGDLFCLRRKFNKYKEFKSK